MKQIENTSIIRSAKRSLYIGVFLMILALLAIAIWTRFDAGKTGVIGDTVGGITSPIVNLIGAYLVYRALQAQVQANVAFQYQIDEQEKKDAIQAEAEDINRLYTNLKDSIDNFSFSTLNTGEFGNAKALKGGEALFKMFNDFYCDYHENMHSMDHNPKIMEVTSILKICDLILNKLSVSKISDREIIRVLTLHQYQYRIAPGLNQFGEELGKHYCSSCSKEHGLPENLVLLISSIRSRAA